MSWVTDDELYGAADRCARKLIEMCAQATGDPNTTPKGSLPKTVVDSLRGDAEDFMFFEPTMLVEEYERVLEVARAIGENAVLAADIDETRNHLINWTGQAATDFKRQLKYLEEFCDRQQTDIVLGLQQLLAAFQLAVHAVPITSSSLRLPLRPPSGRSARGRNVPLSRWCRWHRRSLSPR